MDVSNGSTVKGGIGFSGLLGITFIVLKLTGVIDWSWVWVLSPIWIPICLAVSILVAVGIIVSKANKD